MVERSKTPLLPEKQLLEMGFQIILYANAALYLGAYAIRQGLSVLRRERTTANLLDQMLSFAERQQLIGLAKTDDYERDLVSRVEKRHAAAGGKSHG